MIPKQVTTLGKLLLIACSIIHIFKKNYKLIAIDINKQQVLNGDPKATQQINSTGTLEHAGSTSIFFIIEEVLKVL